MLGCKGSAIVFSPESSICSSCPCYRDCHKAALGTTVSKRKSASATFLSTKFATVIADQGDLVVIETANVSDRIKAHAKRLVTKGISLAKAREMIRAGKNPFQCLDSRHNTAFVLVFNELLNHQSVRKVDLVGKVMEIGKCSKSTASGRVSDALGVGQLLGVVTLTKYTAALTPEEYA